LRRCVLYNRVQRLINIKTAKAIQTTSNEALCTLTGLIPTVIKAEEAAKLYNIIRKSQAHEINHEVQPKAWLHSDSLRITEQHEHAMQIFADGSKSEHGIGTGITMFIQSNLVHQLR